MGFQRDLETALSYYDPWSLEADTAKLIALEKSRMHHRLIFGRLTGSWDV
jgi:hypothetical protein